MPSITPQEYNDLKAFLTEWCQGLAFLDELPPEHHPIAVLELLEKENMAQAESSLGMAINDALEMSWDMPASEVRELDSDFKAKGLLTLSELRGRHARKLEGILQRNKIHTEEEHQLVSGVLDSLPNDASDEERDRLELLLTDYEEELDQ